MNETDMPLNRQIRGLHVVQRKLQTTRIINQTGVFGVVYLQEKAVACWKTAANSASSFSDLFKEKMAETKTPMMWMVCFTMLLVLNFMWFFLILERVCFVIILHLVYLQMYVCQKKLQMKAIHIVLSKNYLNFSNPNYI